MAWRCHAASVDRLGWRIVKGLQTAVDMVLGLLMLPFLLVLGAAIGLWFAIGWARRRAWEVDSEERGKRSSWRG